MTAVGIDAARLSARQVLVESFGFKVATRSPEVRPGHAGEWMVIDLQGDAQDGFALVGDDLGELLLETIVQHGLAG